MGAGSNEEGIWPVPAVLIRIRVRWPFPAAATQVARELGVNANVLHRWMREEREAQSAGKTRVGVKPEQEEIARLRRELARVSRSEIF